MPTRHKPATAQSFSSIMNSTNTAKLQHQLAGHNVVFTTPPRTYREALPCGNGRFGALCYRPGPWEWCINKLDVNLDPYKDYSQDDDPAISQEYILAAELSPSWSEVLKAVERKDGARMNALLNEQCARWSAMTKAKSGELQRFPNVPAILQVFTREAPCTTFTEELNLYQGRITAQSTEGAARYALDCDVDPDQDVMAIRFAARAGVLPITRIVLNRPPDDCLRAMRPKFGLTGDCLWVEYTLENHFSYAVVVRIAGARVTTEIHDDKICATLRRSSKELNLYVTCLTCLDSRTPLASACELASSAEYPDIRHRNEARWAGFWAESSIRIDDDFMENLYYVSQYAFACANGKGMKAKYKAAGLSGLWLEQDRTPWGNGVYGDVNIEAAYQHVFSSNHLTFAEPFLEMVESYMPAGRTFARVMYNLPGACLRIVCGPFLCVGPWYCMLLWYYYRYSRNEQLLRERIYPIMKEFGLFHAHFLRKDANGKYFLFGTCPPERGIGNTPPGVMGFGNCCKNVTIDLAFQKALFKHLIAAAEILEVDSEDIPVWREILANFPDYPTGQTRYGTTIFDMDEWNSPQMCHHPNTLAPVFPGREYHFSSPPAEVALARATVRSCWDNIHFYYTFNAPWAAAALARMGLGDEAEHILSRQVVDFYADSSGLMGRESGVYYTGCSNLWFGPKPGNPPLLEVGCGLITAVNEMLVQEQNGTLFVFPAMPDKWKSAAFRRLRIPGAFLVSANLVESRVQQVVIESEKGGVLYVQNPWPDAPVKALRFNGSSMNARIENGRIPLTFRPGETMTLTGPATPARPALSPAVATPKRHQSLQGYHLFIGGDRTSRVVEAVEQFCFPAMMCLIANSSMDSLLALRPKMETNLGNPSDDGGFYSDRSRQFLEMPQNVYFKLDFGAGRKPAYADFFGATRLKDCDVPFRPVTVDTVYSYGQRYGWIAPGDLRRVACPGKDPLSRTALEDQATATFRLRLDAGAYQFLLLHGNGQKICTRIECPQANAQFAFTAPDGDLGIEGFGIRIPSEQPIDLIFSTNRGWRWRVNALLVKRVW